MLFQYRVCPPSVVMTALTRLGMLSIRLLTVVKGIAFHFSLSNAASCAKFLGRCRVLATFRPSTSHMCWMGFRSGLREGQGTDLMPREDLNTVTILILWQARCRLGISNRDQVGRGVVSPME